MPRPCRLPVQHDDRRYRAADACLLIGANPRWEAPIVNARLRKRYLQGGFKIAAIGPTLA